MRSLCVHHNLCSVHHLVIKFNLVSFPLRSSGSRRTWSWAATPRSGWRRRSRPTGTRSSSAACRHSTTSATTRASPKTCSEVQSNLPQFKWAIPWDQCDRIGRFFKVPRDKFPYKSCPNMWWTFWVILKNSTLKLKLLWGTYWPLLEIFRLLLFQHLVTLLEMTSSTT